MGLDLLEISETGRLRDIRLADCATYIHCHWPDQPLRSASYRGLAERRHTYRQTSCQRRMSNGHPRSNSM